MNNLAILMVVKDEIEYAKLSIESIRLFGDVDNLSVVLVDNHSMDGLGNWARVQEDITYIYFDEGKLNYGEALNQVMEALNIQGDILLMDAPYMLLPGTLSAMQNSLHNGNQTGAVGPVSNAFEGYQKEHFFTDYDEAVANGSALKNRGEQYTLNLNAGMVMLDRQKLQDAYIFDIDLKNERYVITDLCLRILDAGYMIKVCKEAFTWALKSGNNSLIENEEDKKILEKKWGIHYFNFMHNENLVQLIDRQKEDHIKVLEIGCDCGATLIEIKNRFPNANVNGSEINPNTARFARVYANVTVNNIENRDLNYEQDTFDYIIFGDVLEHLRDPFKTIEYCRTLLKEDGCIIASIPNLMHVSVIADLLQGNFTYTEAGLLDKTHIHFFTYKEIIKMFNQGGFTIDKITYLNFITNEWQNKLIEQLLQLGTADRFMYEAFQYILRAKRNC